MSITCNFTGTIQITDNLTGSVALSRAVNLQFVGTVFSYSNTASIGTSPTSITLPVSPVQFVFLYNNSTTATLTYTWTPNGGASNVVGTLQPGSGTVLGESNTTSGITALSLTASGAATQVSYILAG